MIDCIFIVCLDQARDYRFELLNKNGDKFNPTFNKQ